MHGVCLPDELECRTYINEPATNRSSNEDVVEKPGGHDIGKLDLGDRVFGVGDIDFGVAGGRSINARTDRRATLVGAVISEPGSAALKQIKDGRRQ
jgi:hypothetical protein